MGSACAGLADADPHFVWSLHLAEIYTTDENGAAFVDLPEELVEAHRGKVVDVDGVPVTVAIEPSQPVEESDVATAE